MNKYHCDCWDNGEPCCHCGSESDAGECSGDEVKNPCKETQEEE